MDEANENANRQLKEIEKIQRFCFRGCVLGLAIAYPALVALKVTDNFPDRFNWWYIALGPLVKFGIIFGMLWVLLIRARWRIQKRISN